MGASKTENIKVSLNRKIIDDRKIAFEGAWKRPAAKGPEEKSLSQKKQHSG